MELEQIQSDKAAATAKLQALRVESVSIPKRLSEAKSLLVSGRATDLSAILTDIKKLEETQALLDIQISNCECEIIACDIAALRAQMPDLYRRQDSAYLAKDAAAARLVEAQAENEKAIAEAAQVEHLLRDSERKIALLENGRSSLRRAVKARHA
jgi:predicted signal transduction protein with EAL and GGDEF domain